jgi:hypothetical protein
MMVNAYHNISSTHKKQQQKKNIFREEKKKERRRKRFELHCHSMKIISKRDKSNLLFKKNLHHTALSSFIHSAKSHPDAPPRRVAAP